AHLLHVVAGITGVRAKNRVGSGGRRGGAGGRGGAVGSHVDGRRQTIGEGVVIGGGADAGFRRRGLVPESACRGFVVVALPHGREQHVAVGVVGRFDLLEHGVAGDVAGVGPRRVAAAVGRVVHGRPARAVVGVLADQAAGLAVL